MQRTWLPFGASCKTYRMTAAEIDRGVINVLQDAITGKDRYAVLLGAGASAGVGLPGWDALSLRLLTLSGAISDESTAAAFLTAQDPALAAEAAKKSTSDWDALLVEGLYGDAPTDLRPGALHLAVANLALNRKIGDVGLFTLNFDLLIEDALTLVADELGVAANTFPRTSSSPRAPSNAFEVHHLHGAIDRTNGVARDVVLTLSQFNALVNTPRPWQVAELGNVLSYGPLILAGTSYRDPDIRAWLSQLTPTSTSDVIVFLARQGLGLSKTQFDNVIDSLTEQWIAIGVQPVITQDHADAAQVLTELPYIAELTYRTPHERATALWELCSSNFDTLQAEHSDALEHDLRHLQTVMSSDASIVLWLSDASGQAVKWAAADRIYKHVDTLRRVPAGHDSAWIVGQCLGSNEILAKDLRQVPDGTKRWQYVIALPITVERPGGPPFTFASVTVALDYVPDVDEVDGWLQELAPIVEKWTDTLSSL